MTAFRRGQSANHRGISVALAIREQDTALPDADHFFLLSAGDFLLFNIRTVSRAARIALPFLLVDEYFADDHATRLIVVARWVAVIGAARIAAIMAEPAPAEPLPPEPPPWWLDH